jgi:serine/threonine-protein kinase
MIGRIVEDRYLIEGELGNGAMGRVYAARHVRVGRRVAIKVMHEELARNPMIVERFAREALVAARLRHPNLVSVLDVGMVDGRPVIVLELAPGIPLSEIPGALEAKRVIGLIRQLLCGLEHAHAAGLIHRDLKPDNILVDADDTPRIVDFGIAVDNTGSCRRLTEANIVIGTPFYMSPEQARAKPVDHRTDLFSLGVIMYELLAGMPPFPGASVEVALANTSREPPSIFERAGISVDPLLETFARKLMARNPSDRFGSAREALDVLALIECDRLNAARALASVSNDAAAVADVGTPSSLNTDSMSTLVDGVTTQDEPIAPRGRSRFVVSIAMAALVMLAAIGLASHREQPTGPNGEVEVTESIAMRDRATTNESRIEQPTPTARPEREKADPRIVELLAMTKASTVTHPMTMTSLALPIAAQPAVAMREPAIAPVRDSADSVVAMYVDIGRALKTAHNDELWARFRLIRINEAIATADGRRNTLIALAAIETQLAR